MKKLIVKICVYCVLIAFLYVLLFPLSKIFLVDVRSDPLFQKTESKILTVMEFYKQKYLWQVSLKEIAQKLQEIDKESYITVKRKYPGQLIVSVQKKKTALLLLKSDNAFYSISYEGIEGRKVLENLDFPILRGEDFEKSLKLRQRLLRVIESLPQSAGLFCVDNLSEILYNKDNQSFLFYLKFPRFVLELKSAPSAKKKQNIEFVLNYLDKQTQAFIDARPDKKIIVKNKK